MSDDEKLLKTGTAAEFLDVPHRTFQRWAKESKLIPDVVSDGGRNFFSEETLSRFKFTIRQNAPSKKVGKRLPVPQTLVARLLNGGTTTEVIAKNEENASSVEVEVDEFYFDDDDDITVINESFKANLPAEYKQNLTELFGKLTEAPFGEILVV